MQSEKDKRKIVHEKNNKRSLDNLSQLCTGSQFESFEECMSEKTEKKVGETDYHTDDESEDETKDELMS